MSTHDDSRPLTPPHHPTHGVFMSDADIANLVARAFPGSKVASITQLPSGKSFNNRIYFLTIRGDESNAKQQNSLNPDGQELVLKVNGQFFGANKIQNEIACLRLLSEFCPDVPAPRALAWSEDGSSMNTVLGGTANTVQLDVVPGQRSHAGWLLMTRVPGDPICIAELDDATKSALAIQLAGHVTSWRKLIPHQAYCGKVAFRDASYQNVTPDIVIHQSVTTEGCEMVVRGVIGEGLKLTQGIGTLLDYYKVKLEDKVKQLDEVETYAPNRDLVSLLRHFIVDILPNVTLQISKLGGPSVDKFIFTHYDLSPRNVLISRNPLRITGIVDFEFSGFFPMLEEFLNDCVENSGDWPKELYDVYLEALEHNGIATPAKSIVKPHWELAHWMEEILQNTAPWWLPGGLQGAELRDELKKSELVVRERVQWLTRAIQE